MHAAETRVELDRWVKALDMVGPDPVTAAEMAVNRCGEAIAAIGRLDRVLSGLPDGEVYTQVGTALWSLTAVLDEVLTVRDLLRAGPESSAS